MSESARSTNIILAGVGGQGAVLASKLLARAAMGRGLPVKTAETIGMAQRGGSVFSHVRLGEGAASPLVGRGRADAIVAFEPAEAVRQLPFLRPGGMVVTSDAPVVPVSAATGGPAYDLPAIMSYLRDRVGVKSLVIVDAAAAEAELAPRACSTSSSWAPQLAPAPLAPSPWTTSRPPSAPPSRPASSTSTFAPFNWGRVISCRQKDRFLRGANEVEA